ncbi:MAG: 3-hydroxyacyl-CoA dehydrogenase family protein, partial [Gemmatimonadota bacterium]
IVTSNTSGIPMAILLKDRTPRFRSRFLGTHYFNPPRYMHLLELIPTPETAPEVLDTMRAFQERILGKGIVLAKDVPGFVANRLGVHGMVVAGRLMVQHDLTIPQVDTLTGALIGRAKSATFRTGDLSGLDVLVHVTAGLSETTGEDLALEPFIHELVKSGRLGDKTKAGFYKREGKTTLALDWKTLTYHETKRFTSPEIDALMKRTATERLAQVTSLPGALGAFVRDLLIAQCHYALSLAPSLAYDLAAIDRAMEWGYGWEIGPFRAMDAIGLDWLRTAFREAGREIPPLLTRAGRTFYEAGPDGETIPQLDTDARIAIPPIPGQLSLAVRRRQGYVLRENAEARVLDLGDGVLGLEFCGKMNTLGPGVMDLAAFALETAASGPWHGVVIGNDDPRTFTAGANLMGVSRMVEAGDWRA